MKQEEIELLTLISDLVNSKDTGRKSIGSEVKRLTESIRAALAERDGWKKEIEEACIVDFIEVTTPKETLAKLIQWNVTQALDPTISEQPAKWVARIEELELERAEREKRIAELESKGKKMIEFFRSNKNVSYREWLDTITEFDKALKGE